MSKRYLFFDIESHNVGKEHSMHPDEFFRLGQYAWDDGEVVLTTDRYEMLRAIREADYVVGHNISSFDLPALFGADSMEPLYMALNKKVIDTFVVASLVTPAPYSFTTSAGHTFYDAEKPKTALKWYALDNLCYQFKLPGKFKPLSEMAKKHNPPKTKKDDLDFSLIPLDDPEFLEYARQDVIAVRALWKFLQGRIKSINYSGEYIWRELELAAIMARMSSNGILIDQEWAHNRIAEMTAVRERIMNWLEKEYDFPTEGKAPWDTNKGKEVIFRVLADYGITEENYPDWTRTDTGNLSLGGKVLIELTKGTALEEFGEAMATLKGQRSLPQLALDSMHPDGRVHMDITALQRSGRWSFQKPGITVWGSKGDLARDKQIFVAGEGNVLAGFDFSNADARAMAALSGDIEFARRFTEKDENGKEIHDGHNLSGEAAFGAEIYYEGGPRGADARPPLRDISKVISHGQNYNIGAYKLAVQLNEVAKDNNLNVHFWAPANPRFNQKPIERREDSIVVPDLVASFNQTFAFLKKFKDVAAEEGKQGFVENPWKRRMQVDPDRSWTQAPALYGQSATRELMGDALRRIVRKGEYYARALRAVIHDELLMEFNEVTIDRDVQVTKECMETVFHPPGPVAIPIEFPVGHGVGKNWMLASH